MPDIDGVLSFAEPNFYYGEIPEEKMLLLLHLAEKFGVAQAVTHLDPSGENGKFCRDVFDPNRADWRFLIPNLRNAVILDLTAGMGGDSFTLARYSRHVVAVESVLSRARFIEVRRTQENVTNMTVIHADVNTLPFPREQFDLVVANGLFEWVAISEERLLPQEVQRACLRRVTEVLRPGGYLYIGIKNRFGLESFRENLKAYRTYTHTYWGYKRLLYEAGLCCHKFYWVEPSYNEPRCWIPLDSCGPAIYYLNSPLHAESWKGAFLRRFLRVLASIGGAKLFASNFLIIAKRSAGR